jgi:putative drug exporter of the RND superfamily
MFRTVTGFAAKRPLAVIVTWLAIVVAGFVIGTGVFERLDCDVGTVPGGLAGMV